MYNRTIYFLYGTTLFNNVSIDVYCIRGSTENGGNVGVKKVEDFFTRRKIVTSVTSKDLINQA